MKDVVGLCATMPMVKKFPFNQQGPSGPATKPTYYGPKSVNKGDGWQFRQTFNLKETYHV